MALPFRSLSCKFTEPPRPLKAQTLSELCLADRPQASLLVLSQYFAVFDYMTVTCCRHDNVTVRQYLLQKSYLQQHSICQGKLPTTCCQPEAALAQPARSLLATRRASCSEAHRRDMSLTRVSGTVTGCHTSLHTVRGANRQHNAVWTAHHVVCMHTNLDVICALIRPSDGWHPHTNV